jgi:hypothetical protein
MNWLSKHKLISFAAILVITAGAWYMLSGSTPPADAVLVTESVDQVPPEAQDLLNSLHALQSVTLDSAVFSNAAFHVLKDFTTPIVPEPIGRMNPFASLNVSNPLSTGTSPQQ